MARKTGQIIGRGTCTYVVRTCVGRDAETKKSKYISKTIHAGLRDAQTHLIKMMGERDLGRNISSSKQTLNQNLDRWLEVCAKPRLRAKSFQDCEGLLCRYVRPRVGARVLYFHYRLRDSDALPGVAGSRSLSTDDPIYPRRPAISLPTSGAMEAAPRTIRLSQWIFHGSPVSASVSSHSIKQERSSTRSLGIPTKPCSH